MKVCIIQPVMKGYRLPFFRGLNERLARVGIDLQVVYGAPRFEDAQRGDNVQLPPPVGLEVRSRVILRKLLVLPVIRPWLSADLVIVEHANKHLLNFLLNGLWAFGMKRIAYWGHGRNRQCRPHAIGERFKRHSLRWADWWFAYTAGTSQYVAGQGFDRSRITIVENAIDTREFRTQLATVTEEQRRRTLAELGWSSDDRVAVFCGSLYTDKRIDLLFAASDAVHAVHDKFRLLIIGGGPEESTVTEFSRYRPWVRHVGPRFGEDKAVLLSLAEIWLNPGLVGLGILDAFSAGIPILTTNLPIHSPEIEYLVDGQNGRIFGATASEFAHGIKTLLDDPVLLAGLSAGAQQTGCHYSMETMVENFALGIERCLSES